MKKITSKNGVGHICHYENLPGKFCEGPNQGREAVDRMFLCSSGLLLGVQNLGLGGIKLISAPVSIMKGGLLFRSFTKGCGVCSKC